MLCRHPIVGDVVLTVAVTGAAIQVADPIGRAPAAVGYGLAAFTGLPLLVRRRFPAVVLVLTVLALSAFFVLRFQTSVGFFGPLVAAYTVAVDYTLPVSAGMVAVSLVITKLSVVLGHVEGWLDGLPHLLTQGILAVAIGHAVRSRRHSASRAKRAVTEERAWVARELHDVVGHHIAVVSVHANLAQRLLESDSGASSRALHAISSTSNESLDELRRLLHALRSNDELVGPASVSTGLLTSTVVDRLVRRIKAAGVPVNVRVVGTPRALPPALELCAYRVIQESLTNVVKHAEQATVDVCLDYQDDFFAASVANTGLPSSADPRTGRGLAGMRERANQCGGVVRCEPLASGGFRVDLRLPLMPEAMRSP
ncbi:histidine kinase [Kibdelosporangium philippinense]|uniref:histidine kinase n=1 Tax=Kibdelosporangium philippinense TaxID=211113 RepID=A0ABS8ZR88_9PSEU|nr:histidine kinase [Kibdelosporangium philippinense]MCE7010117.1 histidine kinase [Kibdelosporangium philippinense]